MRNISPLLRWLNVMLIFATFLAYLAPQVSPVRFWPLAFFGLMYPLLLLLNIAFVIFWGLQKKYYLLLSLSCIIFGWGHFRSIVGLSANSKSSPQGISIVSFNAHGSEKFRAELEFAPPEALSDIFGDTPPQILCFQEFPVRRAPQEAYFNYLQQKGYIHHSWKSKQELTLFSIFPILQTKLKQFNRSNGYMYADLNIHGRVFRVFNVHLQSNAVSSLASKVATDGDLQEEETWREVRGMMGRFKRAVQKRALQAEEVAAVIAESPYPVIVCGDFNDIPQSYAYHTIAKGLQDSFQRRGAGLGFTYVGDIPGLRIDYLLSSPDFEFLRFQKRRTSFSDHVAVAVELMLPEN
ncbi:MAG: endonuclease/exonuclease/phosphatase family protein [Saprospiraceae bacterium]|nr:endonuclease/exonuclease/phosphatase family protein [Saprospiraceae bacterium]